MTADAGCGTCGFAVSSLGNVTRSEETDHGTLFAVVAFGNSFADPGPGLGPWRSSLTKPAVRMRDRMLRGRLQECADAEKSSEKPAGRCSIEHRPPVFCSSSAQPSSDSFRLSKRPAAAPEDQASGKVAPLTKDCTTCRQGDVAAAPLPC